MQEVINMRKISLSFLVFSFFLVSAYSLQPADYQRWFTSTTNYLINSGEVVGTPMGPIQIVRQGGGPPILVLHGGFGGWDQGILVSSNLNQRGFQTIIPSRPGYLATPIYAFPTDAGAQADLMKALLDSLQIQKAIIMGFSAGAPVAYEFAIKYPDRTTALVLECIGASPEEDGAFYLFLGLALASLTPELDYTTYLLSLSLNSDFYSTALQILPGDTYLTGTALDLRNQYVLSHISQFSFLRQMMFATIPLTPRLAGTLNDFAGIDYWTATFVPPGPSYKIPTLIIQATEDSNGYYPTAQVINAAIPGSQLISVYESGHFIWLGPFTEQWQNQLLSFLNSVTQ